MRFNKISLEIMQNPKRRASANQIHIFISQKKIDMRLSVDRQKEYEQKKSEIISIKTRKINIGLSLVKWVKLIEIELEILNTDNNNISVKFLSSTSNL